MVPAKSERVLSGADCSCSPHSRSVRNQAAEAQPQLRPRGNSLRTNAFSNRRAVGSAATFSLSRPSLETDGELLSRDLLESKFSGSHSTKISNLQLLERLKGDLQSALRDLEEQDVAQDISVADWDKLNAARREHLLEELQRQKTEILEREGRKRERAAKRAARRLAGVAKATPGPDSRLPEARLPDVASPTRRARALGSTGRRGARATAASRAKAHTRWGKPTALEATPVASAGRAAKPFVATGSSTVADYMNTIPQHALLSVSEEAELSQKVKDWLMLVDCRGRLLAETGRHPTLAEWAAANGQEEQAFRARLADGAKARSRMLTCNQRLVISIARRYQNRGMELADLIQEGMTGLIRSIEKFDHTKGFKFSTYATWWVRQSITRALSDLARVIRLPVHLNEILMKINKEEREYFAIHQRYPTLEQVAEKLSLPVEKLHMIKQAAADPRSLEEPLKTGEPDATTLGEVLVDETAGGSGEHLISSGMVRATDEVLKTLTRREHGIMRMRYGLDGGQPKTLEEIGNAFHVTRERIRQIEVKALAKLKEPTRHSSLKPYSSGEAMSFTSEPGWRQGVDRAN